MIEAITNQIGDLFDRKASIRMQMPHDSPGEIHIVPRHDLHIRLNIRGRLQ